MAMGILASGVALGGVLGLLLGGYLEASYGWRVAFMTVGVPGFICAFLVARLHEPSRAPTELTVRSFAAELPRRRQRAAARALAAACSRRSWVGVAAWWLDRYYGADSRLDVATMSAAVGIGLALTIVRWVRRTQADAGEASDFEAGISSAFDDIVRAGKTVLHTPTLVYVFLAGAMISFGINGIVGWGPTFVSRELRAHGRRRPRACWGNGDSSRARRGHCSAGCWPTGCGGATRPAG